MQTHGYNGTVVYQLWGKILIGHERATNKSYKWYYVNRNLHDGEGRQHE